MRGRKPVPTPIRELRGNPGKRPLPESEPKPPDGEVRCPTWLHGRSRKIWRELAPILDAMRVLTVADVTMLADLCETQAEFIEARLHVRKHGVLIERTVLTKDGRAVAVRELNPHVKIASDAGKRAKALMVEFGLSPSSRTRVAAAKPKEPVDEFAEFERGSRRTS